METHPIKDFILRIRARLEKANPENRIFTDYTDNRRDLALAIEALERAMEAIDDIANPSYCDCCDKGYEDQPCTCFEDAGGANRATICQQQIAEILSVKEELR